MHDAAIAHALSSDGRIVVLTERVWAHVVARHENMAPYLEDVLLAIRSPDHREPDIRAGRERFFARDRAPLPWLRVVIEFGLPFDRVITAFGQVSDP